MVTSFSSLTSLRDELARARRDQTDFSVWTTDLRFSHAPPTDAADSGLVVHLPNGDALPLNGAAARRMREATWLTEQTPIVDQAKRLNRWLEQHRRAILRVERQRVRAVFPAEVQLVDNLDLVSQTIEALESVPQTVKIDRCHCRGGDLFLSLVAPKLKRPVKRGDLICGGFYLANSETDLCDTEAGERVFRMVCSNGAIIEVQQGQKMIVERRPVGGISRDFCDWPVELKAVVRRSFDAECFGDDVAQFASTMSIATGATEPLLHLAAQGLIDEEELPGIEAAFNRAGDQTVFGLVNAITQAAHALRDGDNWRQALEMERLGGEIIRGDHLPPSLVPVFR